MTASKIVVGILSLQAASLTGILEKQLQGVNVQQVVNSTSFVAQTYKDWLKSADMHPFILDVNQPINELLSKLSQVDAVLFVGGRQNFFNETNNSTGVRIPAPYLVTISQIVAAVIEENNRGRVMPIWATCLGLEAILVYSANFTLYRNKVDNEKKSAQKVDLVNFQTRSLKFFTRDDHEHMQKEKTFYFNHKFGIFSKDFYANKYLRDNVDVVATIELEQEPVVIWIEFRHYPFIATQFHPEKFPFDQELVQGTGEKLSREALNYKMALLFKSLAVDRGRQMHSEFEPGTKTANLFNIGVYPSIDLIASK